MQHSYRCRRCDCCRRRRNTTADRDAKAAPSISGAPNSSAHHVTACHLTLSTSNPLRQMNVDILLSLDRRHSRSLSWHQRPLSAPLARAPLRRHVGSLGVPAPVRSGRAARRRRWQKGVRRRCRCRQGTPCFACSISASPHSRVSFRASAGSGERLAGGCSLGRPLRRRDHARLWLR